MSTDFDTAVHSLAHAITTNDNIHASQVINALNTVVETSPDDLTRSKFEEVRTSCVQDNKLTVDAVHVLNGVWSRYTTYLMGQGQSGIRNLEEKFIGRVKLSNPDRALVKTGVLRKVCRRATKPFTFFLFTDALIYAESVVRDRYLYHRQIPLGAIAAVKDVPDTGKEQNVFLIESVEKSFKAIAADAEEKKAWLTILQLYTSPIYRNGSLANLTSLSGAGTWSGGAGAGGTGKQKGERPRSLPWAGTNAHTSFAPAPVKGTTSVQALPVVGSEGGDRDHGGPGRGSATLAEACPVEGCSTKFSSTQKRIHCRRCGSMTCATCATHTMLMPLLQRRVRVCDTCVFQPDYTNMESIDPQQNLAALKEIQEMFSGKGKIIAANRTFFRAGPLMKQCRKNLKKYYFFLFSDILVYGEKSPRQAKYTYHRTLPLQEVVVNELPHGDNAETSTRFVISSASKSFIVVAPSVETKQKWIEALQNALVPYRTQLAQPVTAPVWKNDKQVPECELCHKSFSTLRRRHHCRSCGSVVCGKCSPHRVILPNMGSTAVRLCHTCDETHPWIEEQAYMPTHIQIRNLPPEWREMFQAAGVRKTEVYDQATAEFIIETIRRSLEKEEQEKQAKAAQGQESTATTAESDAVAVSDAEVKAEEVVKPEGEGEEGTRETANDDGIMSEGAGEHVTTREEQRDVDRDSDQEDAGDKGGEEEGASGTTTTRESTEVVTGALSLSRNKASSNASSNGGDTSPPPAVPKRKKKEERGETVVDIGTAIASDHLSAIRDGIPLKPTPPPPPPPPQSTTPQPPPPPPMSTAPEPRQPAVTAVTPATDNGTAVPAPINALLAAIREGHALKHVSEEDVEADRALPDLSKLSRTHRMSLSTTLARAMQERKMAIDGSGYDSDGSSSSEDDAEWL